MIVTPISDKLTNLAVCVLPTGNFDKEHIATFYNLDEVTLQSIKFSHVQVLSTTFKDIHISCNGEETPKVYVRVDGQWYLSGFPLFIDILFSIYGEYFTPEQRIEVMHSFRDHHTRLPNNLYHYQLDAVEKAFVDVVRKELTSMQYVTTEQDIASTSQLTSPASNTEVPEYSDKSLQSLLNSIKKATPVKKYSWELKEGKVTRHEPV